jgi:hypothetical protein
MNYLTAKNSKCTKFSKIFFVLLCVLCGQFLPNPDYLLAGLPPETSAGQGGAGGVLEYRSVGVLGINASLHYSITPISQSLEKAFLF